jgi:MYXO-CTERM domain-containing protein
MSFPHRSVSSVLGHAALVLALASTPLVASAQSITDLYPTGVDAAGAPIAQGDTDPHWESRAPGATQWVQAINENNNRCNSCNGGAGAWLNWPLGDAATSTAIGHPDHTQTNTTGVFSWRQSFTVPAEADLSTVTISYLVGFDDASRDATDSGDLTGCDHTVWLNGTAYAMTASGDNSRTECAATIPAGSAFVAGANTIEFRITNFATAYGFRMQGITSSYELATVCGDGLVQGDEACDDGNADDGDGCSAQCAVEDGFVCEDSEFVFNGDFDLGDTGFADVVPLDLAPNPSPCAGSTALVPNDNFYYVTEAPYVSCACDGGQGLCLAVNGGGGTFWSQTLTGLAPNTDYVLSFAHALKDESSPQFDPSIVAALDGVTLATITPDADRDFKTTTLTFTTGANQTSAVLTFSNPNGARSGNDLVLDSVSVTGPSVCAPPCGDGVLDAGEQCDDGNDVGGDGCTEECVVEDGWGCDGEPSACAFLCGNGVYDDGEQCDDGNDADGDGCSASCEIERLALALYSTGVDDAEIPLADGATDTHWEVSVDGGAWVAALNEKNNYCSSCGGVWLEWPLGDQSTSRGITHPDHVRASVPGKTFAWRQSFTVPADADPATVTISYRVGYDDVSRNAADDGNLSKCDHTVWLNGTAYAMTATGDNFRTQCEATIPAGSDFVTGVNTIEFRVPNLATYYGFRLDRIEGSYTSLCGNGALDAGESCDDGGVFGGDGCSETCEVEDGWSCAGEPSDCALLCGDGTVDADEQCDDGNTVSGDGCSSQCVDERVAMELFSTGVDDLGVPLADGATDTHWEVSAGGGAWVAALNEKNNYCSSCGGVWLEWPLGDQSTSRGITHPDFVRTTAPNTAFSWRQSFTLPAGARPDTATISYRVGFDDFSRNATDDGDLSGCDHAVWLNGTAYAMTATGIPHRTQCEATIPAGSAFVDGVNTIEFRTTNGPTYYGFRLEKIEGTFLLGCGDGVVGEGEACDDGNAVDGDGCSSACAIEDGYTCEGEPSACTEQTVGAECGDGVVDSGEACDDGNAADGDGCSAQCAVEAGYTCEGEPSACAKSDGGGDGGDGQDTSTEDEGCAVGGHGAPAPTPLLLLAALVAGGLARRRRR